MRLVDVLAFESPGQEKRASSIVDETEASCPAAYFSGVADRKIYAFHIKTLQKHERLSGDRQAGAQPDSKLIF